MSNTPLQLSQLIKNPTIKNVFNEIRRIYLLDYSKSSFKKIKMCFKIISMLFAGEFAGYNACNTEYHDLHHTMDALLAVARLLNGYNIQNEKIHEIIAANCYIATILHDTGYIQEANDSEGTGAKYTSIHVDRSISFLNKNYRKLGVDESEIDSIAKIIKCTGLNVNISAIPFSSEEEFLAGSILGTADLLGQMSQREYLEKLLFLYYEFKEANVPGFNTEFDIIYKTIDFYEIVKTRFLSLYHSMYQYATNHFRAQFGIDKNLYIDAIENNVMYLYKIIEDSTTNFRHKLKRGEWINQEKYRHHNLQ